MDSLSALPALDHDEPLLDAYAVEERTVTLKSTDSAAVEIPAGNAPRVILRYSFGSSLYHRLVAQARDFRLLGRTSEPGWDVAVKRVADLYLPLGPFNWFEYSLSRAENVVDLRAALDERAAFFARELGDALALVADDYQTGLWEKDRVTLDQSLSELQVRLSPVKNALLTGLARQLGLDLGSSPFEVTLVAHCHEPTGAYSHPTVIGVDCFEGTSLVEVLLHELGHVAASHDYTKQDSGFASMRAACKRLGRNEQFALELFHLILFHVAGQLVRSVCDPSYTTLASRRNLYTKLGTKLGARLTEHDVQTIWGRLERGEAGLDMVVEELNARFKEGAMRPSRQNN